MSDEVMAGYELWDTQSRNLLDDFDTENEALDAVRDLMALNGPNCVDSLALARVSGDGRMTTMARGVELVPLVEALGRAPERRLA